MSLKLMYITNHPQVALIAEATGVDRIFVDLEYIGKNLRQGGMDTVQSHHTLDDVKIIASVLTTAELLVRINPIHEATDEFISSKDEINIAIANGAKILMLPYFKTTQEVKQFIDFVDGRVKTIALLETPEAAEAIDEIIKIGGLDELFIGLNDLSLGYGKKFMFELLADGTVDRLCDKAKASCIPFGFGGLASLNSGLLPGNMVLKEHYRLGSSSVILSRSFCDVSKQTDLIRIEKIFNKGVSEIRSYERSLTRNANFDENRNNVINTIRKIVEGKI